MKREGQRGESTQRLKINEALFWRKKGEKSLDEESGDKEREKEHLGAKRPGGLDDVNMKEETVWENRS